MRHVNYDLELRFDTPDLRYASETELLKKLTDLAAHNLAYLRAHPDTPHLYDAGVVYMLPEQLAVRMPAAGIRKLRKLLRQYNRSAGEIQQHVDLAQGVEIFRDIVRTRENGGGDCDNLASWCAAERALAGIDCRPYLVQRQEGNRTIYHAVVLWPDGSSEDPSIILGMGGAARAADRREECRKNVERYDNYWQDARQLVAAAPPSERLERATFIKAKLDAVGLLPRDGVFRVGRGAA